MPWHDTPCELGGRRSRINTPQLAKLWEERHGWPPQTNGGSLVFMHLCDEPRCGNLDHIVLGTQSDNLRQMAQAGRNSRLFGDGERHWNCKLTVDQVDTIRRLKPQYTQKQLGAMFEVHPATIGRIVSGKRRARG